MRLIFLRRTPSNTFNPCRPYRSWRHSPTRVLILLGFSVEGVGREVHWYSRRGEGGREVLPSPRPTCANRETPPLERGRGLTYSSPFSILNRTSLLCFRVMKAAIREEALLESLSPGARLRPKGTIS
jgi:hypothetical protein